jgi:putative sporulation protein YtaF
LYTFFIAFTNNLDNIGVRIAYSIQGIKISALINAWISVVTFVISFFAVLFGTMISEFLSKQVTSIIAMLLLAALGLWMILEPYIRKKNQSAVATSRTSDKSIFHVLVNPEEADMDKSKHIDFREATLLGFALSINNVGGGVSAGMLGLNSFWVGLLSAMLSFLALWLGNHVSEFFIKWNVTSKANVIGGILLIVIGIAQIIK